MIDQLSITPFSSVPINEILKLNGNKKAPRTRVFSLLTVGQQPNVAAVRRAVKYFIEKGESGRHSERGILLRYIVAYCEANHIAYQLTRVTVAGRAAGYHIKRMGDLDSPFIERKR